MTAPDPVTSPTEDRAEEVAALSAALHEHIDGDFLVDAGLRIGNVGEDVPHWDATVKELVAWAARACAPVVASIVAARVEEARAEVLAEAAVLVARMRRENPMNGDGFNYAADQALVILQRVAGDASGRVGAAWTAERERIEARQAEAYERLEAENRALRAALASPDTTGEA